MPVAAPPSELTPARALFAWQLEPVGLVLVVVAALLYFWAIRAAAGRGHRWPLGRTLVFCLLGLGSLLVATAGWVGVYSRSLFWAYTVQVLVLLLASPIFLALGRPLALFRLAQGHEAADWSTDQATRRSTLTRVLTSPLLGPALVPAVTAIVFFTPLLDWSLHSALGGGLLRLGLVAAGLVFALPLAGEGLPRAPVAIAAATFVGFFELLADAIPGIALRLHTGLLTGYFAALHRPWGPSPLTDQHRGGSILWVVAEVVDLPFLALLVLQWIRADEREAAVVDKLLDSQERESPSGAVPEGDAAVDGRVRPWWETSPEVLGATRAARLRRSPSGPRRD